MAQRQMVIDGHEYTVERGFYREAPSGELYVIESFPDGTVRGVCGPLDYRDVTADLWDYHCEPDDAEDANSWDLLWIDQATLIERAAEAAE